MTADRLAQAMRTARIMHNSDQQELVCLPPAEFKVIREHIESIVAHRAQAPAEAHGLPPLPEPDNSYVIDGPDRFNGDQMRAYARAALSATQPKGTAPASVIAYMAVNREGEARFTDNPDAARELAGYGWAITPLAQSPAPGDGS